MVAAVLLVVAVGELLLVVELLVVLDAVVLVAVAAVLFASLFAGAQAASATTSTAGMSIFKSTSFVRSEARMLLRRKEAPARPREENKTAKRRRE